MDPKKKPKHITVCICTFRRPGMLGRLLTELEGQRTDGQFTYSVVVADNDSNQSARPVVTDFAGRSRHQITYATESRQNIALARNKTLEHAVGDYVAFIDDDEFPASDWLLTMMQTCERLQSAGVLGPVRPHFENPPPSWIITGKFCDRPEFPTGRLIAWEESRTGNLLFARSILAGTSVPFDPDFGAGGEDTDFFRRMTEAGHVFNWCNEGVVFETVPPHRWTRRYMLKRALFRGKVVLKHPDGRLRSVALSTVAVPIYALALLPASVVGHHHFMKYCIRLCDHLGKLLAVVGLNRVGAPT
jgi:succinoglycan biosynthesis protein ExoM